MLIKYNKKNILNLPVSSSAKNIKRLKPGLNEFPGAVWKDFAESHPVVKAMVAAGEIEEVTVQAKKKEGSKAKPKTLGKDDKPISIIEVGDADAKNLVKDMMDLAILERWEAEETRVEIKKSIKAQMDKINKKGASKKSES